jgi:hypothetical protein
LPHGAHQNTFAERQHHRQDAPYLPVIPIAAMPCESGASSKQSQIIEYRDRPLLRAIPVWLRQIEARDLRADASQAGSEKASFASSGGSMRKTLSAIATIA